LATKKKGRLKTSNEVNNLELKGQRFVHRVIWGAVRDGDRQGGPHRRKCEDYGGKR